MKNIEIKEKIEGKVVEWIENVKEEKYGGWSLL